MYTLLQGALGKLNVVTREEFAAQGGRSVVSGVTRASLYELRTSS